MAVMTNGVAVRGRTGRPGREPFAGERVGLSLRVTPETKRSLDAAATAAGRSLSQEAELRLEQSFRDDRLLEKLEQIHADLLKNWVNFVRINP